MNVKQDKKKLPSHYSLSVIVPAFNEEENMEPLAMEFDEFLADQKFRAEVIVVDDGSTDSTADRVLELSQKYKFLRLVRHKQNMGKTAAIESGFTVSRGKRICIFDADLQYDVLDIKRMMDKLDRGYGIVSGIKKGKYQKPFISKIYNKLTSKLFGVEVKDMNSLKLLRRDVMASLFLRKDWHRFMVVLAAEQGYRVAEIPVTLRPRLHGEAKYGGFGRVFVGFTDLIAVWLAERVFRKPMLIFGSVGFMSLGLGILLGVAILLLRVIWHWGYPPLQTILILLISIGGFSLTLGFLAEAIANLRDRLEFFMSKIVAEETPRVETARTTPSRKKKKYKSSTKEPRKKKDITISGNAVNRKQQDDRTKPSQKPKSKTQKEKTDEKSKEKPKEKKKPKTGNEKEPSEKKKTKASKPTAKEPIKESRPEKKEPEKEKTENENNRQSSGIEFVTEEPSWGKRGRKSRSNVGKADDKEAIERARHIVERLGGKAYLGYGEKESEENNAEKE